MQDIVPGRWPSRPRDGEIRFLFGYSYYFLNATQLACLFALNI